MSVGYDHTKPVHILLCIPAFGNMVTGTTFLTTHNLMQALWSKGIGGGISTLSFPDIAELRSMYATIWYDTMPQISHMLFIDADMGFAPDVVIDMLLLNEPLVGAIYRQRREQVSWAGSGTGSVQTIRRGPFMEVEGVGMGCTLIRRDCIHEMVQKMPEMIDTRLQLHPAGETLKNAGCSRLIRCFEKLDLPERGVVSEDLSFCIRWRKIGGKVWGSIGHRFSHVGQFDYAGRYLDHIEQQQGNQFMRPGQPQPQAAAGGNIVIPDLPMSNATGKTDPVDVAAKPAIPDIPVPSVIPDASAIPVPPPVPSMPPL